jgi:probable HAF family extracellular repeat protein
VLILFRIFRIAFGHYLMQAKERTMLKNNFHRGAVAIGLSTLLLQSGVAGAEVRYWVKDIGLVGSQSSYYSRINNAGQAIGTSTVITDPVTGAANQRCFLYSNGVTKDLGTLGGDSCSVQAINNMGDVIGTAAIAGNTAWHPFLYHNGVMTDLETVTGITGLNVGDINDSGQISLLSWDADGSHLWLYTNGVLSDLGASSSVSNLGSINNFGEIAGSGWNSSGMFGFLASNGAIYDLGSLGGGNTNTGSSNHRNINDNGQIIGSSKTDTGEEHGFIYQYGMMQDMGNLGGSDWFDGRGINQSGEGFGNSQTVYNRMRGFLYTGGTLHDMGTQGGFESCNHDINNNGVVVGHSKLAGDGTYLGLYDSGPNYIYVNGQMTDLNTLVPPANSYIYASYDGQINDNGQIYLPGFDASSTQHAVLLTPLPVTTATIAGTKNTSGWYTTSVTASLAATDAVTGVKSISYSLDGAASKVYSAPISVTTNGTHTITYQATDKSGHVESTKQITFSIKKTGFLISSLPLDGTVGTAYTQTLASTGGTAPVTWTLAAGTLPTGLTLKSTGVISGTPSKSGTFRFSIKATDKAKKTTTSYLTIAILDRLTITTPATAGFSSIGLTATGGKEPYTWSIDPANPLQAGSVLESATVNSTGTIGSTFGAIVTDARGISTKKIITLSTVDPTIAITVTGATTVKAGTPVSITSVASGGATGAFTWTIDPSSPLPAGLALNPATGAIKGTATAFGTIALIAIDSLGNWSNTTFVPFNVN